MKHLVLATAFLLALPAAFAVEPVGPVFVQTPTCGMPGLEASCVTFIYGDITVEDGDEQQFNDGRYVIEGTVTVEDGGTLEIIDASVNFSTSSDEPVRIHAGGTVLILNSYVGVIDPSGGPRIIIESGANATLSDGEFRGVGVRIETADATVERNRHRLVPGIALELVGFNGLVNGGYSNNDTTAIRVEGGCPTIQDFQSQGDGAGFILEDTCATLERIEITEVGGTGILAQGSQGTWSSLLISDRWGPPTGVEITDSAGAITIDGDTIVEMFSVGIFTCNATVIYSVTDFQNNLIPAQSC